VKQIGFLGIALACLMMGGCFRFYVNAPSYQPVPPKIDRPALPEDKPEEHQAIIMEYALKLETAYNSVRADNIAHNEQAGFPTPQE